MHEMIEIDGSFGEGGGQILRTALSLSCLFRKPFRIFNIRQGRKKPGLMPQHLTGVKAAQVVCNAEAEGDKIGSSELTFLPGDVRAGDFSFDIGTAGSTMLVLQTLIPALIFSGGASTLTLTGGTHVPFSPSYHYVKEIFLPFIERIGIRMELFIETYGFYPKGGGKVRAEMLPLNKIPSPRSEEIEMGLYDIKPLRITDRGRIADLKGYSGVGNLPMSIAERQREALLERLRSESVGASDAELIDAPTPGQGTFVFLKAQSENSLAGFTSLGEMGKRAEAVGREAADAFLRYYASGSALDPHLADQIVLYLSMCKEESVFTTSRMTKHLTTNLRVIGMFHEFRYSVEGEIGQPGRVVISK